MTDQLDEAVAFPLLAAPDIDRSLAWYESALRFAQTKSFGDYGIARRGAIELHFWKCADRKIAENTSCYIQLRSVEALDTLNSEWRSDAIDLWPGRLTGAPQDFDHGMREFHLWDPAGNLLRFGANIN